MNKRAAKYASITRPIQRCPVSARRPIRSQQARANVSFSRNPIGRHRCPRLTKRFLGRTRPKAMRQGRVPDSRTKNGLANESFIGTQSNVRQLGNGRRHQLPPQAPPRHCASWNKFRVGRLAARGDGGWCCSPGWQEVTAGRAPGQHVAWSRPAVRSEQSVHREIRPSALSTGLLRAESSVSIPHRTGRWRALDPRLFERALESTGSEIPVRTR